MNEYQKHHHQQQRYQQRSHWYQPTNDQTATKHLLQQDKVIRGSKSGMTKRMTLMTMAGMG
jgi:hypothetical protein